MSRSCLCLFIHVVWATNRRMPFISKQIKKELYRYIGFLIKHENAKLIAIGGVSDHVHILIRIRSNHYIPNFIRNLKTGSSKFVNQLDSFPDYFAWQKGYGIFTVSPSMIDKVAKYIYNQETHHTDNLKFEDELQMLQNL